MGATGRRQLVDDALAMNNSVKGDQKSVKEDCVDSSVLQIRISSSTHLKDSIHLLSQER
jgi:hypothetical protein